MRCACCPRVLRASRWRARLRCRLSCSAPWMPCCHPRWRLSQDLSLQCTSSSQHLLLQLLSTRRRRLRRRRLQPHLHPGLLGSSSRLLTATSLSHRSRRRRHQWQLHLQPHPLVVCLAVSWHAARPAVPSWLLVARERLLTAQPCPASCTTSSLSPWSAAPRLRLLPCSAAAAAARETACPAAALAWALARSRLRLLRWLHQPLAAPAAPAQTSQRRPQRTTAALAAAAALPAPARLASASVEGQTRSPHQLLGPTCTALCPRSAAVALVWTPSACLPRPPAPTSTPSPRCACSRSAGACLPPAIIRCRHSCSLHSS